MYILTFLEGIDKVRVAAQMCHDAELDLRVVGRYDDPVGTARHEGLADLLAPFRTDRYVLQVWLGRTKSAGSRKCLIESCMYVAGSRLDIRRQRLYICGEKLLHPNDDVNMSQSSNDTFPTAMHIAAVLALEEKLLPAVKELIETFKRLEAENEGIVKSGRTHLQDATPITFSQEISGWRSSLEKDLELINRSIEPLYELALGGTAVGTGLNAPAGFDTGVAAEVAKLTGKPFVTAANKFHSLTSKDELVFAHGAIKALACDMMKIANDVRWLASGPRDGLGEIFIPENEPGSSIMPGKVNPTQCEAVTMVAVQVMGNDVAVGMAASQGNFELNVFMPVCIYNFLQSARLLAEAIVSFNKNCAVGIKANKEKMHHNLHNSLMLVTALNPYIGYENAAKTAKKAFKDNISLKEACVELGFLTAEKFDEVFHPEQMV